MTGPRKEKSGAVRNRGGRRPTLSKRPTKVISGRRLRTGEIWVGPLAVSLSSLLGLDTLMKAVEQRMEGGQVSVRAAGGREKLKSSDKALVRQRAKALETLESLQQKREQLIETMLPKLDEVPASAAVLQARRNAKARELLLKKWGGYTSAEMGRLSGSTARNRAAIASRWKNEGRVFSLTYQGKTYFPSFQFDEDGRPLPLIARVVATLGRRVRDWDLALWFDASSGWLGGEKPIALLTRNPEAVVTAAEREAEELAG